MNIHNIQGILSRIFSLQQSEKIKILNMDLEILLENRISKYTSVED